MNVKGREGKKKKMTGLDKTGKGRKGKKKEDILQDRKKRSIKIRKRKKGKEEERNYCVR